MIRFIVICRSSAIPCSAPLARIQSGDDKVVAASNFNDPQESLLVWSLHRRSYASVERVYRVQR